MNGLGYADQAAPRNRLWFASCYWVPCRKCTAVHCSIGAIARPCANRSDDASRLRICRCGDITRTLDSIDLAYGARAPTQLEQLWRKGEQLIQIVFFPSSFALIMKGFVGYMGPPTHNKEPSQVKRRYNHLARLAMQLGHERRWLSVPEEPSLSKKKQPALCVAADRTNSDSGFRPNFSFDPTWCHKAAPACPTSGTP